MSSLLLPRPRSTIRCCGRRSKSKRPCPHSIFSARLQCYARTSTSLALPVVEHEPLSHGPAQHQKDGDRKIEPLTLVSSPPRPPSYHENNHGYDRGNDHEQQQSVKCNDNALDGVQVIKKTSALGGRIFHNCLFVPEQATWGRLGSGVFAALRRPV